MVHKKPWHKPNLQLCVIMIYRVIRAVSAKDTALQTDLDNQTGASAFQRPMHLFFYFFIVYLQSLNQNSPDMRIDLLTVVPEMLTSFFGCSIMKRAQEKGLARIVVHNLRDYTTSRYRKVDDYPFGGEAGMVMQIQPIDACISALKAERHYDEVIFMTPDGETFSQPLANSLSLLDNIIILCGHYKGVDWRVREHLVTREISIGDYVLTGGELPGAVVADAVVRLLPGVIGDEQSALSDSFQDGLLAPPVYSRPADYNGWKVPDILLSGHEAKIAEWRYEQALERTRRLRPDLLDNKE